MDPPLHSRLLGLTVIFILYFIKIKVKSILSRDWRGSALKADSGLEPGTGGRSFFHHRVGALFSLRKKPSHAHTHDGAPKVATGAPRWVWSCGGIAPPLAINHIFLKEKWADATKNHQLTDIFGDFCTIFLIKIGYRPVVTLVLVTHSLTHDCKLIFTSKNCINRGREWRPVGDESDSESSSPLPSSC